MWRNDERSLPTSLQEFMRDKREVTLYESWWESGAPSDMVVSNQLARPVNDLGVAPLIEEDHRTVLKDAIKKYLEEERALDQAAPDGVFLASTDPQEVTWADILGELGRAKATYEQKGAKNPIRRMFRKSSSMQRNIKPWVEGIPQDNGLGLIKGGLQIVLHAIQRRSETCQVIFDTFASMPRRILHAECLLKTHTSNREFCQAVEKLYYELIKCLPNLISILLREDQSRWKKLTKPVYGDSTADVNDILKPVISAQEALQERQFELISQGIVDTIQLSQISLLEHQATQDQLQEMQQEILTAQKESQEELQRLREQQHEDGSELRAEIKQMRRQMEQIMKNGFYVIFQDNRRVLAISQANALEGVRPSQAISNSVWDLTESLCDQSERDAPFRDRASVLRKYHDFSNKALARANQLFTQPRFRQWVANLRSDMLLINGQCGGDVMGNTSPISVFCASLAEAFGKRSENNNEDPARLPQSPQLVLEYFCGQHNVESSGLSGPCGMMRSLLDQLLRCLPSEAPLNLQGAANSRSHLSRQMPLRDLCALFMQTLLQLPKSFPVWCIVDNISYFDTSVDGQADELADIIECFSQCVQEGQIWNAPSASVKFLLATANRSIYIWQMIDESRQLTLEDGHTHSPMYRYDMFHALSGGL